MNGIAGIVYPDEYQVTNLLPTMLDAMSHRTQAGKPVLQLERTQAGKPVPQNEYTHKNIQLGACGGNLAQTNDFVAALDGTLSNRRELTLLLKAEGYDLPNPCDSHLILHGYRCWGSSFLEKIQGDFALFIYDKGNDRLILARDRIGKKPLYWFRSPHFFIFGSELKALLATGAVPQTPALDSLATYLYLGYTPQDMTPIKNVNKLLPGYYLRLDNNHSMLIQSYWSYSSFFQKQKKLDKETVIQNIDELLQQSITKQLSTHNTLGCLLAGGLGSASIAHYLRKLAPQSTLNAYGVEFQRENVEDINAAGSAASNLQIPFQVDLVTQDNFLDDLVPIVWHLDEPLADPHVIAVWRIAKAATPMKVFYSGMGSDELLAGHSRYTIAERHSSLFHRLFQFGMPLIKKLVIPALNATHRQTAFSILQKSRTNPWQIDFLQHNALFGNDVRFDAAPSIAKFFDPIVFLHKFHNLPHIPSNVASFLYFDVKTRLPDCFMLQYERLTSAHGLDWRTPYLSEPLIEYAAGLPEPDELTEADAFYILKAILKNAAFSEAFINRPKKTRKQFMESWAENSELRSLFEMLPKGTLVDTGLISQKWLKKSLETAESRKNSFRYLWAILMLEMWFHLYINRPISAKPPQISTRRLLTDT